MTVCYYSRHRFCAISVVGATPPFRLLHSSKFHKRLVFCWLYTAVQCSNYREARLLLLLLVPQFYGTVGTRQPLSELRGLLIFPRTVQNIRQLYRGCSRRQSSQDHRCIATVRGNSHDCNQVSLHTGHSWHLSSLVYTCSQHILIFSSLLYSIDK